MTIGIDVSMLNYQGSGVASYTFNLVKNLLKYDKTNEYRLFYSSLRRPDHFYYLDELSKLGGKIYDFPFPKFFLEAIWGKLHIIPIEWLIGRVDVFFSSDFLRPPTSTKIVNLTTVHDLTWKLFPQYHEERIVKAHERKLSKTVKYNDTVIADSKNTKKDLLKYYPQIKENHIHVIYPAVGEQFIKITGQKEIKKVLNKYNVGYPSRFVLYTGAIEPRKNLETAIRVFHQLITFRAQSRNSYSDFQFLIVGRGGWKNDKIYSLVNELGLEKKIIFTGFVEDADLPYFYNAASVFIYLSKYEGFGLPPLEAAACGTPTLLYNNSSLKEIFKPGYPYTKNGEELETLKKLIEQKPDVKKFIYDFSWKTYCKQFLKIIAS